MNKEIEEMSRIIQSTKQCEALVVSECIKRKCQYPHYSGITCLSEHQAEALYNEGYHKTVWHKVADGDLPKEKECTEIYCCYNCPIGLAYDICTYFTDYGEETPHFYRYDSEEGWIRQDDIIAWTELPKYEGEKR